MLKNKWQCYFQCFHLHSCYCVYGNEFRKSSFQRVRLGSSKVLHSSKRLRGFGFLARTGRAPAPKFATHQVPQVCLHSGDRVNCYLSARLRVKSLNCTSASDQCGRRSGGKFKKPISACLRSSAQLIPMAIDGAVCSCGFSVAIYWAVTLLPLLLTIFSSPCPIYSTRSTCSSSATDMNLTIELGNCFGFPYQQIATLAQPSTNSYEVLHNIASSPELPTYPFQSSSPAILLAYVLSVDFNISCGSISNKVPYTMILSRSQMLLLLLRTGLNLINPGPNCCLSNQQQTQPTTALPPATTSTKLPEVSKSATSTFGTFSPKTKRMTYLICLISTSLTSLLSQNPGFTLKSTMVNFVSLDSILPT